MLNTQTTCPNCDGSGLAGGAVCAQCGGTGEVRAKRHATTAATPATSNAPAAFRAPTNIQPERNDNAERLVRTLLESGVTSAHMLDAIQLLALGGAAAAGVVQESDDVVQALAERVVAQARERLGLLTEAAAEPKRGKGKGKRDEG